MKLNPIYLENDTTYNPQGKCSMYFTFQGIGEASISNFWYVSTLKNNLLYVVLIRQGSHQLIMEDGFIKINQ
jgi:hypothetical protein